MTNTLNPFGETYTLYTIYTPQADSYTLYKRSTVHSTFPLALEHAKPMQIIVPSLACSLPAETIHTTALRSYAFVDLGGVEIH